MSGRRTGIEAQIEAAIPRLHRFAWALTGDRAEADDVTQGALEKALIHQRELVGKPVEAWLMRVAKNLWLDQIRRKRVRSEAIDPELWGNIHWLTPPADGETRAQAREALKAFADLPVGQKELCALVLVEGYSYQEAAEVLQIPIGTVMSRLSRARLALAERLLGPERAPDLTVVGGEGR